MSELKPCPLCGNTELKIDDIDTKTVQWMVWCDQNKGCSDAAMFGKDKQEAIRNWNNAYCWKQLDLHKAMIERLVERMEMINGPDSKCVYENGIGDGSGKPVNAHNCPNHSLIHEARSLVDGKK